VSKDRKGRRSPPFTEWARPYEYSRVPRNDEAYDQLGKGLGRADFARLRLGDGFECAERAHAIRTTATFSRRCLGRTRKAGADKSPRRI